VHSGELARLIREDGLLGMTSEPDDLQKKAIASSDSYRCGPSAATPKPDARRSEI
jgi:hypothetical protein